MYNIVFRLSYDFYFSKTFVKRLRQKWVLSPVLLRYRKLLLTVTNIIHCHFCSFVFIWLYFLIQVPDLKTCLGTRDCCPQLWDVSNYYFLILLILLTLCHVCVLPWQPTLCGFPVLFAFNTTAHTNLCLEIFQENLKKIFRLWFPVP